MAVLTPPFRASGLWELKSPWNANPVHIYTCTAIRKFDELLLNHVDIYTDYFLPKGLSYSAYQASLDQGASLITILSEYGEEIDVPDTYISRFPTINVADYKHIVVSASLGALPSNTPIAHIISKMSTVLEEIIGRKPTIQLHVGPTTNAITVSEAKQLETVRQAAITNKDTTHVTLSTLEKKYADTNTAYLRLKAYTTKLETQLNQLKKEKSSNTALTDEKRVLEQRLQEASTKLNGLETKHAEELKRVRKELDDQRKKEVNDLVNQVKALQEQLKQQESRLNVPVVPEMYRQPNSIKSILTEVGEQPGLSSSEKLKQAITEKLKAQSSTG